MLNARKLIGAACGLALGVAIAGGHAAAGSLGQPEGNILLTISGDIMNKNDGDAAIFDLAMLEGQGNTEVVTTTAWTEGQQTFEGALVSQLMDAVGAMGETAEVIALNDYKVDIPVQDFRDYPVILAYRMNGEELKIRDKGPLWIVYPQDDHPELQNKKTQAKWVWQVKEIRFK